MSEVKYTELLRSPHWQRKRLEAMQRDDFRCRFCGDKESTLNVHHVLYLPGRNPWDYDDEHLVTVCEKCHTDEERLKSEDPFLINMLLLSGLSRRKLYNLASALRTHLRYSHKHEEKFQDLMDYLHNT
jgi:hypothetical protein